MNDKTKPQDDLSIEEILGSIRRIIAEDEDDATSAQKPAADAGADDFDDENEPLELTNKIQPDGTIAHTPIDDISMDGSSDDIIDIGMEEPVQDDFDIIIEDDIAEPVREAVQNIAPPQEPKYMSSENSVQDNLLSPSASIATAAVMAKLARQAAVNEDGNNSLTIEAMVKEMLRPMLKEWLDANLPELVQKMVERELERLTKRL